MSNRRRFMQTAGAGLLGLSLPNITTARTPSRHDKPIIGHGDYRYRLHQDWGIQDARQFPVQHCHEMVIDRRGRIFLLNSHPKNNILIYDRSGKVLDSWTLNLDGAHGLTLIDEGGTEYLWITDPDNHKVVKTTLDGKVVQELFPPGDIYEKADYWKPTETAVAPNGDIYVADGYGQNYITQYDAQGKVVRYFGGKGRADALFDCCHGVTLDTRGSEDRLIITSRSNQCYKYFSLDGQHQRTVELNNMWICRPVLKGDMLYFAVIVSEDWGRYDGMLAVIDANDQVVSLPGGAAPNYEKDTLQKVVYDDFSFLNPHDVCIDSDDNLYVAQWNSGRTYPYMLERV